MTKKRMSREEFELHEEASRAETRYNGSIKLTEVGETVIRFHAESNYFMVVTPGRILSLGASRLARLVTRYFDEGVERKRTGGGVGA